MRRIVFLVKKFQRDERGASAIEFAVIASFLSIILLNAVDISNYMYRQMQVTGAVRAGAQYALVNPSNLTDATVDAVVTNAGTLAGLVVTSDLTDNCGCSDGTKFLCSSVTTCGAGTTGRVQRYATINASYTHTWIFYPGDTEITATATVRKQ